MTAWIDYQPKRDRDKEIYDIMLRDGTVVQGCYPNGVHWNPIFASLYPVPKTAGRRPIADYRVMKIRRTEPDPWKDKP